VTSVYTARPHQGIGQQLPEGMPADRPPSGQRQPIHAPPIMGGLHHALVGQHDDRSGSETTAYDHEAVRLDRHSPVA